MEQILSLLGTFPKKTNESSPKFDESDNLTLDGEPCLRVFVRKLYGGPKK